MGWTLVDFSTAPPVQQVFDYAGQTDGQPKYAGMATTGVPTSEPKWRIRLFTYDANRQITNIQYANGDVGFRAIWDNRATLVYK